MAKVEIEEADLLNYQHISGVVDTIMKDPAARTAFLQTAKKANPKLAIPEVDAAAPVIAAMQGINKKMDDFIAAQAAKEAEAKQQQQIAAFQNKWASQEQQLRQRGWMPNGIEQVKQFAENNGIADLTIAADAFERRNPQPDPARSAAAGWNLFSGTQPKEDTFVSDMMPFKGDNDAILEREIAATLQEIRSNY